MTFLLDTNTCMQHLRSKGTSPASARLAAARSGTVVLCSVVRAELVHGAHNSVRPAQTLAEVVKFADGFHSYPFDDAAADVYGQIRKELELAGTPIGPHDTMIAAIARLHGLVVVTQNVKHFGLVRNLQVTDWQTGPTSIP